MAGSPKNNKNPEPGLQGSPVRHLRQEYEWQQALFNAQPPLVQRFLEGQARLLSEAIIQHLPQISFKLPDRIVSQAPDKGESTVLIIPPEFREQMAGGLVDRITRADVRSAIAQRLAELEQFENQGVAVSAGLIRYATAIHLVHNMLPAGRTVTYRAAEGEEIPSIPVGDELEPESAITATTDAIVEEGSGEEGRGELLVPYVPAARIFYLPQWVAFDDKDQLIVNAISEAEAHVASMQRFVGVLHFSIALAAYIVADDEYQQKRYGMLGQLVNQGRALARYQTQQIIQTIKSRAKANDLNRGLSLSLPYFDDQDLEMKLHRFEVIPSGRIMFVPAFVVRAARMEQAKVVQDTRLNYSTRQHLLAELRVLEGAFKAA
jgi:hypothetical protein